jgi:sec-independent protein translocase protein TatA
MFGLGHTELIIILVVVLILFGGRKLPELARGLGQGMKEFKAASREAASEEEKKDDEKSPAPAP